VDVQEQEAAVGEIDGLGKEQVLNGLGEGEDLGKLGCLLRDGIAGRWIDVDGVDAACAPNPVGQLDCHVS
jgi:hypothetical protein